MKRNKIAKIISSAYLVIILFINGCTNEETLTKRPNFLLLTCEDISPMLSAYGDSISISPNLDKLVKEGILMNNAFSVSGVCAPSRAALITGMYPTSIGAQHMRTNRRDLPDNIPPYEAMPPADVKCFTEFLRNEGYYCTNNVKTDYQFKSPITAWDDNSENAHWRNRPDKAMPFLAVFNFDHTHEHKFWANKERPLLVDPNKVFVPPYLADTPTIRRDIARVYSNIIEMDSLVGEYIKQLKEDNLYDDTIIIFFSDNGGPMPRGKREITDSGIKVPMIIKLTNSKDANTKIDDLVSFVDVPATILSLASVKPPDYMHGIPFLGEFKGGQREYIFAARDRMDTESDTRRAIRNKDYLLIKNYHPEIGAYQDVKYRFQIESMLEMLKLRDENKLNKDQMYWFRKTKNPIEFYDVKNDPFQLNDLSNDPRFSEIISKMTKELDNWVLSMGDKGILPEKDFFKNLWPNGVQPKTETPIIQEKDGIIEMNCETEGASIAYQIDGKGYNEEHWFLYSKPVKIKSGTTISSTAIRIGYTQSDTAYYSINNNQN